MFVLFCHESGAVRIMFQLNRVLDFKKVVSRNIMADFDPVSPTRRNFLAATGGVLAGAVAAPRVLSAAAPQSDDSRSEETDRGEWPARNA